MTDTNTLLGWLNQFVTHRRIDEVMDKADYEAVQDMNTHLRAQEARIAELAPWKDAVIDALAVCCGDCAIGTPPSDVLKLIASINQQFTEQNCKDREDERIAALTKDAEPLSTTFIQTVPDKCDRIVWRGDYFHLPPKISHINFPTNSMEQEFANYERRGYEKGLATANTHPPAPKASKVIAKINMEDPPLHLELVSAPQRITTIDAVNSYIEKYEPK